jgi:hypothetical protein
MDVWKDALMPCLLIRQRVRDFARWKTVFDDDQTTRRAHGSLGGRLFRNAADPDELLVLMEWDDLERARLFLDSDDVRVAMTLAGVTDRPDIWLLEEVASPSA